MTKTILITGSTDGIGLLTAQKLSQAGHHVLLHGRSASKLAAAAAQMEGTAAGYVADLSDLAAVRGLAEEIRAAHPTLDVLINNAGVLKAPNPVLESGQDLRFVVNTLAPHVLTEALRPIIPVTGRVINLSSAAQARVQIDALLGKMHLSDMEAYAQSKLALTILSQKQAGVHPDGPAMIAVNPGSLLASKMVKEGFGIAGSDLGKGADILVEAALGPRFADASGRYFDNDSGAFAPPNDAAADPAHVAQVMAAIETLTRADA